MEKDIVGKNQSLVIKKYRKVFKLISFFVIMLRTKKISEVIGKRVYTDSGDFFGEVEEVNLVENKIDSWRIRVAGEMISFLGGAQGVVIPHQFVKAIGDICIVSKANLPAQEEQIIEETEEIEL